MIPETLSLKKQELQRRINNLPVEVQAWKTSTENVVDKNAHFSQLRAIELLTNQFVDEERTMLDNLDPNGNADTFNKASFDLVKNVIRAQRAWDFFRDKLDLRFSPNHKRPLWVADTIAWDCHRTAMNNAVQFGIIDSSQLREPPLVYCTAEFSPATWVRGSRPNDGRLYDLGESFLPIPVIEMPWDHLGSSWEYLALHHEVGHDIEADLKLRTVLLAELEQKLAAANVPVARIKVWKKWEAEIFADLCGLQLAGPAFTEALIQLLLLPVVNVKTFDEDDPHPTHYTRILMNVAYIRTLGNAQSLQDHATQIEARWKELYGNNSGDANLDAMAQDFSIVFDALMNTQFAILQQHTVRDLIPFSDANDTQIRLAQKFFATGMNRPNNLPLRYTVSAARLAIAAASSNNSLTDQLCADIHERVMKYVEDTAPQGLRGGGQAAHETFIKSFTKKIFV